MAESDVTWDPETYPTTIRDEIHDYEELQERVARATAEVEARSILELGIGTGETAARVLALHPDAHLTGLDSSPEMIASATQLLPAERVAFVEQDLAAPLPDRTFDVVYSALAIHHLEGERKKGLFAEIARHLAPGGVFVLGDVIVPANPNDAVIELEPDYDLPSSLEDQVRWLEDVGLGPSVDWVRQDLAVIVSERRRSLSASNAAEDG